MKPEKNIFAGRMFINLKNIFPALNRNEEIELKASLAADLWAALKRKEAVGN